MLASPHHDGPGRNALVKKTVQRSQVRRLTGKRIFAVTRKGTVVGKLVRVSGQTLYLRPESAGGKKVKVQAILPLVLYDLLAVGTAPYAGYPGPYPGGPFYPGGPYPKGGFYPKAGPWGPGYGAQLPKGGYPYFY